MKEETKDLISLGIISYFFIKGISLIIVGFYFAFKYIKYIKNNFIMGIVFIMLIIAIVGLNMVTFSLDTLANYKQNKRIKKLENKRN